MRLLPLLVASAFVGACFVQPPPVYPPAPPPNRVLAADGTLCTDDAQCASTACVDLVCASLCDGVPCGQLRAPDLVLPGFPTPADDVAIPIPAGVVAFTVTLVVDDSVAIGIDALRAPDGTAIIETLATTPPPLQPAVRYFGATTALVPATDDPSGAVQAGTYTLRAAAYASLEADAATAIAEVDRVLVWFTRAGDEGGVLDLALHVSPGTGLAPDLADPYVAGVLTRVDALLDLAGVRAGALSIDALAASADVIDSGDAARALCAAASEPGVHGRAVNLFLVDDVTFTAGFAGGIPGPTGVPETAASGIVAEDLGVAEDTGLLLAHEIGHFLGLRHTTDQGGATDPLADTPSCDVGTPFEECPDYTNVMFPFFPLGGDHVLSEGQVRVLRASPLLREQRSDALCPGTPAYDVTRDGTARGETTTSPVRASASCGGVGTPERTHIYRVLRADAQALSVRVTTSVNATVSIALGCGTGAVELACAATEAGVETELTIETPARGAYAIVIDGDAAQFALDVTEI